MEERRTHEDQIVITLALIQKALEDLTVRVNDHHKVLFGNGSPENSILWAVKALSESIEIMSRNIDDIKSKNKKISVVNVEDLTWKQWGKKFVMQWFPFICVVITLSIIFHSSVTAILIALSNVLGG